MKCDDCLNLLEMYIDGEAGERNNDQVREHLMKCESCTGEFEALTAESELYQRYDRDLQISPAIWNGVAARIAQNRESVAKPKSNLAEWFAGLFAIPRFGFAMPALPCGDLRWFWFRLLANSSTRRATRQGREVERCHAARAG